MILSSHSWHYRLAAWVYGDDLLFRISLCRYFWMVVFAFPLLPHRAIWEMRRGWWRTDRGEFFLIGELVAVTAAGVIIIIAKGFILGAIIFGVLTAIAFFPHFFLLLPSPLGPQKLYRSKRPNLLIEYLKARKQKVCPIIAWEEEG